MHLEGKNSLCFHFSVCGRDVICTRREQTLNSQRSWNEGWSFYLFIYLFINLFIFFSWINFLSLWFQNSLLPNAPSKFWDMTTFKPVEANSWALQWIRTRVLTKIRDCAPGERFTAILANKAIQRPLPVPKETWHSMASVHSAKQTFPQNKVFSKKTQNNSL